MNQSHFIVLCLIFLVTLTQGQTPKPGECPGILPQADFDSSRFEGRWYEQRRTPRDREDNLMCVSFIYNNYKSTTIKLDRYALKKDDLTWEYISNVGYIVQPGEIVGLDGFHYLVPFTDYNKVAIIYGCKQETDSFIDVAWILTRKPYPEKIKDALDAAESIGLYRMDWIISDQRRCSYVHN